MEGLLVIISAPSGVGKTTLIKRLLEERPEMVFAVSHTTRPKREGEVEGRDYYFVDEETFSRMVAQGEFLEWAVVHQHRYGTSKKEVERLLQTGRDVVFEVDFQGGRALMRHYPEAVSIFILPPSLKEVERRLRKRGTDDEETIALRLKNARIEIATAFEYRYAVINDDVERALREVLTILDAERLRSRWALPHVRALVAEEV